MSVCFLPDGSTFGGTVKGDVYKVGRCRLTVSNPR